MTTTKTTWVLVTCPRCGGAGRVNARGFGAYNTLREDCPDCRGTGTVSVRGEGETMTKARGEEA